MRRARSRPCSTGAGAAAAATGAAAVTGVGEAVACAVAIGLIPAAGAPAGKQRRNAWAGRASGRLFFCASAPQENKLFARGGDHCVGDFNQLDAGMIRQSEDAEGPVNAAADV